ncbi:hypothetical protein ABHN11_24545 [Brevibacillus centrosporus]|uniref:hypothetical protein n=1 Tax=Brevibacillus centrosporus TaxID=54910 RepID=UPI003D2320F5
MDVLILMETNTLHTIAVSRIQKIHPEVKYYHHIEVFNDLQEFLISANPSKCIIDDNLEFFHDAKLLLQRKNIPFIVFQQDFSQLEADWEKFVSETEQKIDEDELEIAGDEIIDFQIDVPEAWEEEIIVVEEELEEMIVPVFATDLDEEGGIGNKVGLEDENISQVTTYEETLSRKSLGEDSNEPVHFIVIEEANEASLDEKKADEDQFKRFGGFQNTWKSLRNRKKEAHYEEEIAPEYNEDELAEKKFNLLSWFQKKQQTEDVAFAPSKKVVAVASLVGGAGASFVSGNIAHLANRRGVSTALIESPSTVSLWESFVQKKSPLEKIRAKQDLSAKDIPQLHGISFFPYPSNWPRKNLDSVLKEIAQDVYVQSLKYEFVVIDISHDWNNPLAEYFLTKCDSLLIVVPPSSLHVESVPPEKIDCLTRIAARLGEDVYFVGNNWTGSPSLLDDVGIRPFAFLPPFKKQTQASMERKFILQFEEGKEKEHIFNKIINVVGGM